MKRARPMSPRSNIITNQPVRGPKGHLEPLGGRHEPPFGDVRTCKVGIITHKVIITHAIVALIIFTNANFIC